MRPLTAQKTGKNSFIFKKKYYDLHFSLGKNSFDSIQNCLTDTLQIFGPNLEIQLMLQEDAPYSFYNRPVAAHDHTHPVARPLAPVTFYTQILRFTQPRCTRHSTTPVTQRPAHPPHHTHITHSPAEAVSHRACSVTNHTPGYFLWPPSCQVPLQAHTVSHPKNYTHAETQLTLSQRRGRPRNPHGVARVKTGAHTQTHAHEAGYKGPHACEPCEGTTPREESDRIRLARARPQDGTHGRTRGSRLWRSVEARTAWTGPRCELSQLTSRGRGPPTPGLKSPGPERACACALRAQPTGFRLWTTFPRNPRGWCKLPPGGPLAVRAGFFSHRG